MQRERGRERERERRERREREREERERERRTTEINKHVFFFPGWETLICDQQSLWGGLFFLLLFSIGTGRGGGGGGKLQKSTPDHIIRI